jgi:hypothetical protein
MGSFLPVEVGGAVSTVLVGMGAMLGVERPTSLLDGIWGEVGLHEDKPKVNAELTKGGSLEGLQTTPPVSDAPIYVLPNLSPFGPAEILGAVPASLLRVGSMLGM